MITYVYDNNNITSAELANGPILGRCPFLLSVFCVNFNIKNHLDPFKYLATMH